MSKRKRGCRAGKRVQIKRRKALLRQLLARNLVGIALPPPQPSSSSENTEPVPAETPQTPIPPETVPEPPTPNPEQEHPQPRPTHPEPSESPGELEPQFLYIPELGGYVTPDDIPPGYSEFSTFATFNDGRTVHFARIPSPPPPTVEISEIPPEQPPSHIPSWCIPPSPSPNPSWHEPGTNPLRTPYPSRYQPCPDSDSDIEVIEID